MLIKYIKAKNYKTYKNLNLNLDVSDGKSIILIGGENMCGKTTLFDAIGGALYGLDIKTPEKFKTLMNYGYTGTDEWKNQSIELEILFEGYVLGRPIDYKMRRIYKIINDKVVWSVRLDFGGNTYIYGTHNVATDRQQDEENVNKIIKANLPPELREYFLFDTLKVGNLVESEQINALIEKNIRSVMGFNKYLVLKETAKRLLDEANASRLNNEEQRKEYTELLKSIEGMKAELEELKGQKEEALAFSIDNNDIYKRLLEGQKADSGLNEKMNKARNTISDTIEDERKYNQRIKDFVTSLETDVFIPKIVEILSAEAKVIIEKKNEVADKKKGLLTDKQIETVTKQILDIIRAEYGGNGAINADFVAERVKAKQTENVNVTDDFYYLDDDDVAKLRELMESKYANPFVSIDRERVAINQRVSDIPKLRDNIDAYKAQIAGDDYSIIKKYEENEQKLNQLKIDIAVKERDIAKAQGKIEQFNVDDNSSTDYKYDTLKKLPELFDTLSERLLAARKSVIEQNLKNHLNKLIRELEGVVERVEMNAHGGVISFKIFHKKGNEIMLDGLSAAGKQILIQVLLKELRDNGDYDPPVMIDSVMGNFDTHSRNAVLEHYFPNLATQTILFSNDREIDASEDGYGKLRPYIAKAYLLNHNREEQFTTIEEGYFDNYK